MSASDLHDGGVVEIALVERREGERLFSPSLEMDIGNPRAMLADHRRDVAAGRGEMRGVGTEIDRGQPEDPVDLGRPPTIVVRCGW